MTPFKSALEASSYQSPDLDGPFHHLRQKVVQAMVDQGIERSTLVEHGVSWAEDQDPFGHVMGQTYPHVISKTFTRLLESFQEVLKDKFSELVAGRGISVMTNRCNLTAIQMVKYPDLLVSGVRITNVKPDRFVVVYSIWSAVQNTQVFEAKAWIVFVKQKVQQKVNLLEEDGVYSDLHASLIKRAEEAQRMLNVWEEKQKAAGNKAKL